MGVLGPMVRIVLMEMIVARLPKILKYNLEQLAIRIALVETASGYIMTCTLFDLLPVNM